MGAFLRLASPVSRFPFPVSRFPFPVPRSPFLLYFLPTHFSKACQSS